jgi:arabinogalactan endo-1,4-beta-galactosidase
MRTNQNGPDELIPCAKLLTAGILSAVLLLAVTTSCSTVSSGKKSTPAFVLGADVSALAAPGRWQPARAYQENGKTNEEWAILMNHGWTMFRLRVFVSPVRKAPNNSLENTIPLAKRIKAAGGSLLLCLHLSDTWADPGHQETPTAWQNMDIYALEKQVEAHCFELVKELKAAGAMPDWVQVGNEITAGTLWPTAKLAGKADSPDAVKQWENFTRILKAGIRGVKSAAGDTQPRFAIHIDRGANWKVTEWFFDHIDAAGIDYDIIAQSYYPTWHHGTLEGVRENMEQCARKYKKDFLIVETGYDRPHSENTENMKWPVTPEGRLEFMRDLIKTVKNGPRGIGVLYWAPEPLEC